MTVTNTSFMVLDLMISQLFSHSFIMKKEKNYNRRYCKYDIFNNIYIQITIIIIIIYNKLIYMFYIHTL